MERRRKNDRIVELLISNLIILGTVAAINVQMFVKQQEGPNPEHVWCANPSSDNVQREKRVRKRTTQAPNENQRQGQVQERE